ncbi:hypothetical protein BDN72DRAFT_833205 [Pluteus cervinus]|uniref:Uncharacterized protein n=1 Tax=Pluteus cervinus TaxID=181527 RepID=A0ACD3BA10_9AGAR|nr:hypothetical protein BDN72DRAFT_833205 [Pluteus cervinus]
MAQKGQSFTKYGNSTSHGRRVAANKHSQPPSTYFQSSRHRVCLRSSVMSDRQSRASSPAMSSTGSSETFRPESPPWAELEEMRGVKRHPEFGVSGGDLYLQVRDHLFQVHRFFLERDSPRFRGMLATPATPGLDIRGTNPNSAILIEEDPDHWALLMKVFYNPQYSLYDFTFQQWTIILGLAIKWRFDAIRDLTLRQVERLSESEFPISERIALYEKHKVEFSRLLPHYLSLCLRPEPLSEKESEVLGVRTTVMVFQVREKSRLCKHPHETGASMLWPPWFDELEVKEHLCRYLGEKLPLTNGSGSQNGDVRGSMTSPRRETKTNSKTLVRLKDMIKRPPP